MNDVTAIIKTFERPHHLARLIKSIRTFYPTLPILVADDSRHPTPVSTPGVRCFTLPYDTGLSYGRNHLVTHTRTPRLVLLDDDFIFTVATRLERLTELMDANPDVDILGGRVEELPHGEFAFDGLLQPQKGRLMVARKQYKERRDGLVICEVIPNFFMAKTASLRRVRWDPALKLAEHLDFFLRARGQLVVGFCNEVVVQHDRCTASDVYKKMRSRSSEFQLVFERKAGLRQSCRPIRRKPLLHIVNRRRR